MGYQYQNDRSSVIKRITGSIEYMLVLNGSHGNEHKYRHVQSTIAKCV